jgi:hypothetical protein
MTLLTEPLSFDSLPLHKNGPHGNAWGLFGEKDELGMLNWLTHANTVAAAKEIVHGIRVSTDWYLDQPKIPCFGRVPFEQKVHHKAPRTVNDDILTFNTQSSSQWDGFRHFGTCLEVKLLQKKVAHCLTQVIRIKRYTSIAARKGKFINQREMVSMVSIYFSS